MFIEKQQQQIYGQKKKSPTIPTFIIITDKHCVAFLSAKVEFNSI